MGDFSSRLGLPDELVETLNADHRQMVKCTGKDDDRYRDISGVLKQLLGRPDTTQTMTVPISTAVVPLTEGQPSNGQ